MGDGTAKSAWSRLGDAGRELVVGVSAVALVCALGKLLRWGGPARSATSTALWPFYLDTWNPPSVLTARIALTLGAFALLWVASRRWVQPATRAAWGGLALVMIGGYLWHLTLGIQRHGVEEGLTRTLQRNGLEYWGDIGRLIWHRAEYFHDFPQPDLTQHGATHPPGLTILLSLVWRAGAKALMPATLVCSLFASLAALALYGAARRLAGELTARYALVMLLCACSVAAFAILAMDIATMFFTALALYGLVRALDGDRAGAVLWGFAFAYATLCTYATALCVFTYATVIAARLASMDRASAIRTLRVLALGPLAFVAVYLVLVLGFGYRPIHAYRGNALAFARSDDSHRSYWRGLLGSPVAFLGALGLPLAALVGHALGVAVERTRRALGAARGLRTLLAGSDGPLVSLLLGGALPPLICVLLGTPRGEIEHVFLPFIPPLILGGAEAARRWFARSPRWVTDLVLPLLALQSVLIEIFAETFW